jgi:hypothetical protein
MRADARVGGHFVQGHVDSTGTIEELRQDGDCWWVTVRFPPSLAAQIVRKGSIAIDGISLTVAGVDDRRLDVQIIPFTWQHTNLKAAKVNDPVNLECDMLGKYVLRAMEVTSKTGKAGRRQDVTKKTLKTPFASIEDAVAAIRDGRMIIVVDDEDRENEGDLTIAAESVTPDVINFMATHGPRADLPVDDGVAARRARAAAGGERQHDAVQHGVLRPDRREAARDDGHLGRPTGRRPS